MTQHETIMHLADNFASLHRHSTDAESGKARATLLAAVEAMATGKQSLQVALTDAQIDAIMQPLTQNVPYSWRSFARAIEQAHGISLEAGK